MAAKGQSSHHLAEARRLLGELTAETEGAGSDPQTKATVAAAHAILVLAEQVAVARVVLATDAAEHMRPQQTAPS
jgi:hypothetical protein